MKTFHPPSPRRPDGARRRSRRSSFAARVMAMALGAALLPGCGNVTSGGLGEVEVLISSDTVANMVFAAAWAGEEGRPPQLELAGEPLQGTLTVTVRSFVREGLLRWIEITDGPQELVLPLDDPTPVVVARRELAEGDYQAIRTLFGRVRVQVDGGLLVGGEPFTGEIRVDLSPDGVLVAEERGVRVERHRPLPILLELRVRRWLAMVDRERRTVPEPDFRREFRIRTPPGR